VRQSPRLKATGECPRPTRTESLPKSSSGDLGTAADVVVGLIQRIFVPVTVNDGLDEFRSFVCPANEATGQELQLRGACWGEALRPINNPTSVQPTLLDAAGHELD
jgi:hypothetical protein